MKYIQSFFLSLYLIGIVFLVLCVFFMLVATVFIHGNAVWLFGALAFGVVWGLIHHLTEE